MLTRSVQGMGVVPADLLNSYIQCTATAQSLRSFTGLSGMIVYALGTNTVDDGGQGNFYFNSTSTAVDNGVDVIAPNGAARGRWLRQNTSSAGGANVITEQLTVTAPNTLSALSQSPVGGLMQIILNDSVFLSVGAAPAFTISGRLVIWLSSIYSIGLTDTVYAVYTY